MSAEERLKWDRKHAARGFSPPAPSDLLTAHRSDLPQAHAEARAIDIAGGSGRHALWLAEYGFTVTLIDISETALQIARDEAAVRGLDLSTICADLETAPFPTGPWQVILCFHYLHRPLIAEFTTKLAPNGVVVFVQPTVRNLERHSRPSRRFLLDEGELLQLANENGLEPLVYEEVWSAAGRHEALLIASQDLSGSPAQGRSP
jgi:tellurite methyltransferase